MQLHRANRSREKRILKAFAEQMQARVNRPVLCDRVHLHADFLPFIIIAFRGVPDTFGSRSRHLASARAPVALITGFAVISDTASRRLDTFCVIHHATFFHLLLP